MIIKIINYILFVFNILNLFTFINSNFFIWKIRDEQIIIEFTILSSLPIFVWYLIMLIKNKKSKFLLINFLLSLLIFCYVSFFFILTYEWDTFKIF
jgi:hypothetical protein